MLRLHAQAAAHLPFTWYPSMFGIGLPEMIVIFAVALIVIGPDKLPELARSLARGLFELKRTLNEMRGSFSEEEQAINSVRDDLRQTAEDLRKKVMLDEPPSPRQLPAPDEERLERARRSGPPADGAAGQNAEPEILPPAAESRATAFPPQSSAEQSAPETTAPRS